MRISVTTTSKNLHELLTADQIAKISELADNRKYPNILLQNLSGDDIFIETINDEASFSESTLVLNGGNIAFAEGSLAQTKIISKVVDADVRIIAF